MHNESNKPAIWCGMGFVAPEFCLPAIDGKFYSLADVQGPRGLLVVLLADGCPYVDAILPRIARDVLELHRYGIGAVAINPGHPLLQPAQSLQAMAWFAREHRLRLPYLLDAEQKMTRALGATHTPDFFGFDHRLQLRYHGRLDASRREPAPPDAKRELFAAMRQIALFCSAPRHQLTGVGSPVRWRVRPAFCKDSTAAN
jgi:peroxiredoxin